MSNLEPGSFYRRNLPHFQPPGATMFITFRLIGSIPSHIARAIRAEHKFELAKLKRKPDSTQRNEAILNSHKRLFAKWDAILDQGAGPDWLKNPKIAVIVAESMHFFDKKRYDLLAYCIMSNHVHIVFTPLIKTEQSYFPIAQIMHAMKGYSARKVNLVLGREGVF
ncbi:MAG: transposase [Anaerolineales bacterium]|nr:transposase [Anaerolineales bacterium]